MGRLYACLHEGWIFYGKLVGKYTIVPWMRHGWVNPLDTQFPKIWTLFPAKKGIPLKVLEVHQDLEVATNEAPRLMRIPPESRRHPLSLKCLEISWVMNQTFAWKNGWKSPNIHWKNGCLGFQAPLMVRVYHHQKESPCFSSVAPRLLVGLNLIRCAKFPDTAVFKLDRKFLQIPPFCTFFRMKPGITLVHIQFFVGKNYPKRGSITKVTRTHIIHVRYVYLHFPQKSTKCR